MNKRNFLKSIAALPLVTLISGKAEANPSEEKYDRMKLSHHYSGAYHEPNDLFTPEEITEARFVFVGFPTFIHDYTDPWHPIMKSYVNWSGHELEFPFPNECYLPIVCRSKMCVPAYTKTYDLDAGRRRGIESLPDYFNKKAIFKPMILDFMHEMEYHYVYRVTMGTSPCSWNGTFGDGPMIHHMYPVFIRGSKLPKKV
jgi:hypothetical protein